MNYVELSGTIYKDPQVRYAASGLCWASWTTLVTTATANKAKPAKAYIQCKAFGEIAQEFEKIAKKDMSITIEGHIVTGSYNNKDGHKVYTTDVVADKIDYSKGVEPDADDIQATVPQGFTQMDDDIPF